MNGKAWTYRPEWMFDNSPIPDPLGKGERAVKFLNLLKHPKSTASDNSLEVAPFFERLIRRVYGDTDQVGNRKIKTVFVLLPRGNRKTTIGAALALLHTIGPEKVTGGQCLSAAADREQARLAYDEAVETIEMEPKLQEVSTVRDYRSEIEHVRKGATYKAVSADGKGKHGKTPTFVLADELHAWPKRDLWEALRTGLVKVSGSILWVITTAGRGQENLAHNLYSYAKKVASGEIDDLSFLPVLFEASANDDWRDEDVWHLVNPGLEFGYPDVEGLRQLAREGAERPADRESFKQLHLNIWQDRAVSSFIDMSVYDEGGSSFDLEEVAHLPCWLGVDLSSSGDLTVVVAAWRDSESYFVKPWFFCPAENLDQRQMQSGAPYLRWSRDGQIEPTPGNVVDLNRVEAVIRDLCERFDIQEIAFDPALSHGMMANLTEDGLPVVEMRQGALTMMPAIATLERVILGRKLTHAGDEILRWCFENVEAQTNTHGHTVRLVKSKRWLSIDGAVASAMAVGRAAIGDHAGALDFEAITGSPDGAIMTF